ncbi:hypothetical protein B9Z19DRAFT_901143, partial [Tuber borchii]
SYKLVRNRFISTFKRDKLGLVTKEDRRIIAKGNSQAHGGDAVADARLYEGTARRSDPGDFQKLYGLPPTVVSNLTHPETVKVLNCHASVIASDCKKGSPIFYHRFATFIKLFVKSGHDPGYLDGKRTPVTDAYWAFLQS